jgi:hypothetical protein
VVKAITITTPHQEWTLQPHCIAISTWRQHWRERERHGASTARHTPRTNAVVIVRSKSATMCRR